MTQTVRAMIIFWTCSGIAAQAAGQSDRDTQSSVVAAIRRAVEAKHVTPTELRQAAEEARRSTPENQLVQKILGAAMMPATTEQSLRSSLETTLDILTFQPVQEAPLPKDFPPLTPVGEIRVNQYPSYRLARTATTPSDRLAFWRLFRHIQSRGIAMTAPVEMTYANGTETFRELEMAFLYRSVDQGEVGQDGKVEVRDVPAQQCVSIGWQGDSDSQNVAEARQFLDAWLQKFADKYRVAGSLRVMGHNSPFVAVKKRYFEVQIPIEAVAR